MICFDEEKTVNKLKLESSILLLLYNAADYKSSNSRTCPYCRQDGGKITKKNDGQKFNSLIHNSESLYNFQEIELKSKLMENKF